MGQYHAFLFPWHNVIQVLYCFHHYNFFNSSEKDDNNKWHYPHFIVGESKIQRDQMPLPCPHDETRNQAEPVPHKWVLILKPRLLSPSSTLSSAEVEVYVEKTRKERHRVKSLWWEPWQLANGQQSISFLEDQAYCPKESIFITKIKN